MEMEERRNKLVERMEERRKELIERISLLKTMELNCLLEFNFKFIKAITKTPFLVYIRDIRGGSIKLQVLASHFNLNGSGHSFPFPFLTSSKKGPLIYVQDKESNECLHYRDLSELKQIPIFDLPLYMDWAWKSPEFSQLLSGTVNKGSSLDHILKKAQLNHG